MTLSADSCYRALTARDRRFDGVFFVGVETTGVYCRPICPARTPSKSRCVFFARSAEAERAGFRACFRCRPELAPGLSPADSVPRLVRGALARIDAGYLDERSLDDLAAELGVGARHLRRAMEAELGVSPVEYAQTRRLALAKQLLHDTQLSVTDVAFASGFSSIRRFNALFAARFGRAPSTLRQRAPARSEACALRLDFRPPLDFDDALAFLRDRAIPGVELVDDERYRRTVRIDDRFGWLEVRRDPRRRAALVAEVSISLVPVLAAVSRRLRALFDLDAAPDVVDRHLERDPLLAPLVARSPGVRAPGSFDPFETAVRAVLGQMVSVRAARTLSGRLVQAFGRRTAEGHPTLGFVFPTAAELSRLTPAKVRTIGVPEARARTIVDLARAVDEGRVDLSGGAEVPAVIEALQRVPGVGPWTAEYVAMRALRWPDAFPASDLGVMKALGVSTPRAAKVRAEALSPWRSYAVIRLWSSLSRGG